MTKISWHSTVVPSFLEIKQVYGILFDEKGRILLRIDEGHYKFTGGKPEPEDENMSATLRRELLEEINVSIKEPYYIGYQLIEEEGAPPYAQVRMVALIEQIGIQKPDSDNGKRYGRILVPYKKANTFLNYGVVGDQQIAAAVEKLKEKQVFFCKESQKTYLLPF